MVTEMGEGKIWFGKIICQDQGEQALKLTCRESRRFDSVLYNLSDHSITTILALKVCLHCAAGCTTGCKNSTLHSWLYNQLDETF